jgi:hypothetical protein
LIDNHRTELIPLYQPVSADRCHMPFQGLAPFLRLSNASVDLRPLGQAMLEKAGSEQDNADLWMSLANIMMAMGLRDAGLAIQSQALTMRRVYRIAAAAQPARLRLLMLMAPGDLAANTPLECLLENCDIELVFYYLSPGHIFAEPIPDHDLVMVALSEADEHRDLLDALTLQLAAAGHQPPATHTGDRTRRRQQAVAGRTRPAHSADRGGIAATTPDRCRRPRGDFGTL